MGLIYHLSSPPCQPAQCSVPGTLQICQAAQFDPQCHRDHGLRLLVPTWRPPQAPGLNWDESTTGKGGRERRELCPKLETPWESVKEKKKKSKGLGSARPCRPSAGQVSGAQGVFGGERSLGLMDFAVEEGKKTPSLHTLSMCYKATGAAGQGRTAWKGIHHPNSHSALRQSCQQLVTNTPLCSLTRRTSHPHTLHCLQKFPPKQTQTFREQQRSC